MKYKITDIKVENGQTIIDWECSEKRFNRAFDEGISKKNILEEINDDSFKYLQGKIAAEEIETELSPEKDIEKDILCPPPIVKIFVNIVQIATGKIDIMGEPITTSIGSKEVNISIKAVSQDLEDKSLTATLQVGDVISEDEITLEVEKDIIVDYVGKEIFNIFGEKIIKVSVLDSKGQKTEAEKKNHSDKRMKKIILSIILIGLLITPVFAEERSSASGRSVASGRSASSGRTGVGGIPNQGWALDFDGTDDYVSVGDIGTGIKSVEFWINNSNAADGILELIDNSTYVSISSSEITATGWTSPTIYVNGVVASALSSGWHYVAITTETGISAASVKFGEANTDFMQGVLDNIRIYDKTLHPTTIFNHFKGDYSSYEYDTDGNALTADDLKGYWAFDETAGTIANDTSKHGNKGTIHGATWEKVQREEVGLVAHWKFNEGMGNKLYDLTLNNNDGDLTGFNGTATGGSTTTLVDANLTDSDVDALYVGAFLEMTGGSNDGEKRTVSAYDGDNTLTVSTAFTNAVANTDTYIVGWQIDGIDGNGLLFDGANDYVDCGSGGSLRPGETLTISYWFNPKEWGDGVSETGILGCASPGIYTNLWNNKVYFQFWNGAALQGISFVLPSLDEWYHIVGTYDKNAGSKNFKIYSNGVLQSQQTKTGSVTYDGSNFLIGKRTYYYFNGSIADVRIYDRALSADEIEQLYNAGR